MSILFQPIEHALNTALSADPESSGKLLQFHGRSIQINITDINQSLCIQVKESQLVVIESNKDHDLLIAASLFTLLKLKHDPSSLFSSEISIKGDVQFAKQLQDFLSGFDFDWEAQIARVFGDTLAYPVAHSIRHFSSWFNQSKQSLTLNMVEYLQEEIRMLPVHYQIDDHMNAIDALRADCERLEARINRLQGRFK